MFLCVPLRPLQSDHRESVVPPRTHFAVNSAQHAARNIAHRPFAVRSAPPSPHHAPSRTHHHLRHRHLLLVHVCHLLLLRRLLRPFRGRPPPRLLLLLLLHHLTPLGPLRRSVRLGVGVVGHWESTL